MRIFHTDAVDFPLPGDHRFPLDKYRVLRRRVERELSGPSVTLDVPEPVRRVDAARVHTAGYLESFESGALPARQLREIGLPWSPQLVARTFLSVGATLAACRSALADGRAVYLGGGTHHAFADRGAGFCILNDGPIALLSLLEGGRIRRALIVDLDAHQGDGTAAILAGEPRVFTLSVHCEKNFPFRKQRSDLDVSLAEGTSDTEYLERLGEALGLAFEASRPDLVLYLAGSDPFEGDRLGRLALTRAGLRARDVAVYSACESRGVPVAVVMAGGYARPIDASVDIHFATVSELVRRATA